MLAALDVKELAGILAPTVALLVGIVTLLVNGERAERRRRRELYARGLAAALAYAEMPFEIRRRRHEEVERSAERVRLTTRFSDVQAELSVCQTRIDSDGTEEVASAYRALVAATRRIAGSAAREAWNSAPIEADSEVNMPELAKQLQPLEAPRDVYADAIRHASRSPWRKFCDAIAASDSP